MGKKVVTSMGGADLKASDRKVDTRAADDQTADQQQAAAAAMGVALDPESAAGVTAAPSVQEEAEAIEQEMQPSEGEAVETPADQAGEEPAGEAGESEEQAETEAPAETPPAEGEPAEPPIPEPAAPPTPELNDRLTQSQAEGVRLHNMLVSLGIDPRTGVRREQPPAPPLATPPAAAPATPPPMEAPSSEATQQGANQAIVADMLERHQAVVGPEAADDYRHYVRTGSDYFLFKNPKLLKLAEAVETISERLPFSERVRLGYEYAFRGEIEALRVKQAKAAADIARGNPMAPPSVMRPRSGGGRPTYTPEQLRAAQLMDVQLT